MHSKLAAIYSSKLATKLISLGAKPPVKEVVASAAFEEHGFQVIVTIAPYQGPMRIHQSVLDKIMAMANNSQGKVGSSGGGTFPPPGKHEENGTLTETAMDACIMEAAPPADGKAVSMKRLATLAGYAYTLWFRQGVDRLIVAGKLVRTSAGVRKKGM